MKYWFRRKIQQIHNLIIWFPTIWGLYNWDYGYAIDVFKFQLRQMQKNFESDKAYSCGAELRAVQIKRILNLMDAVDKEVPFDNVMQKFYAKYGDEKLTLKTCIINGVERETIEFVRVKDNYLISNDEYVELHSKMLMEAHNYQEKAHKLVWKLISENIKTWWD